MRDAELDQIGNEERCANVKVSRAVMKSRRITLCTMVRFGNGAFVDFFARRFIVA